MPNPEEQVNTGAEHLRLSEERFRLLVESVRDYAIFMLDPAGHVLSWNAGAERFKGYTRDEILGKHFSTFYPQEALQRGLPSHELEVAGRVGSFEDEGWRVRKDGSLFWANVVITAMRDPRTGELVGFAKVTRDLTQRRNHEEALRRSEERFRLMVDGVKEYAIFMLDVNGRIETWNSGAERIKGYTAEEIIGQHFSIFYPQDVKDSGWPEHELREATEKGRFVDIGWRVRKDGTMFWANVTITALRDDDGRLIGFAKLTRDLTESKRVEAMEAATAEREALLEAERTARIAAQRTTRVKDEFLATLSHELRTPLSAILGWTQVLLRGTSLDEERRNHAVEVIDRNARAQVQLIDDLLDLSRIVTGKVRLDLQQVVMQDVVTAAVESAMPSAQAKQLRLVSVIDPNRTLVNGDSGRLQQVVWNLLTNAVKFTPKGGRIEVLLQRVNSHVELSVTDTGIGIPAHFLPHVFERFSQKDGSTTRAFGGLGLGLAISKQLIELHGGTIRVSSPGEGMGSTFMVELPLSLLQVEDEREREHPTVEGSQAAELLTLPTLKGLRLLIVDDERDARELLQRVFEDQGATVMTFSSAQEALDALKSQRPNVIVSDIGMPGMDGYEMMRTLRAGEPPGTRIPAVALTAFARAEDRKRALLAGYQSHIAKPFDLAELMLMVSDLAKRD